MRFSFSVNIYAFITIVLFMVKIRFSFSVNACAFILMMLFYD